MNTTETIMLALISASGFWALLQYILQRIFENKAKKKQAELEAAEAARQKQMDEIHTAIDRIENKVDATTEVSTAIARDRLNHLCEKYMRQGYINRKEVIAFKMLGEAYCEHNNTEIQTKFEWVMENLDTENIDN